MTQPTYYQLPNEAGLAFRQHLNENLSGQGTDFAGAVAPISTQPFMRWLDTSMIPPVLRRRASDNLTWEVETDVIGIGNGRTQSDKNAELISVKDFGAIGDGVVDDTAALTAAFAAAPGKRLRIPAGTYISGPLILPSNAVLVGDGRDNTVIKAKTGIPSDFLTNSALQKLVIEKITIDGNATGNPTRRAVNVTTFPDTDGPAWIMRDSAIINAGNNSTDGSSFFINGLCWVYFNNVRFISNYGSFYCAINDSVFDALFVGNSGTISLTSGLHVVGGSSNQFLNCYFGGCGNIVGSLQISQVIIEGSQNIRFVNCTNDSAQGHGYQFRTWTYNSTGNNNCSIIGGLISNPGQGVNNTYHGVVLGGDTKNTLISSVQFTNPLHVANASVPGGAYAVYEADTAAYNTISGCVFENWQSGVSNLLTTTSKLRNCPESLSHPYGNGPLNMPYISGHIETGTYTPVFTGLTVVNGTGGVTYSGKWTRIGNRVDVNIQITTSGDATTASLQGVTYCSLPFIPTYVGKNSVTDSGLSDLGGSALYINGNCYLPTWSARNNYIFISGTYFID